MAPGTPSSKTPLGSEEEPRAQGWIAGLPNLISAGRLGLAAAFPFAPSAWLFGMIIAAGVSDAADGFIARRFHATSWQGGILDAVADKAFTLAVLATFAQEGSLPVWQIGLLLCRDVFVTGTAVSLGLRGRWDTFPQMKSRLAGKATTVALFALMLAIVAAPAAVTVLVGLAITCSGAATVDYAQSYQLLEKRNDAA